MTETQSYEIVIVTDGEGNACAHKARCAHLNLPANNRRLGSQLAMSAASKREVIEQVYGGFEDLEDDPENWAAFAAHEGFRFIACCDRLLPAEVAPVVEEPAVEIESDERLTLASDVCYDSPMTKTKNVPAARPVPCQNRMNHPHLMADSTDCNPAYVQPIVLDFNGTEISIDDRVQINSATDDADFLGGSHGTVVGFDNGALLVKLASGTVEQTRGIRVRIVAEPVETASCPTCGEVVAGSPLAMQVHNTNEHGASALKATATLTIAGRDVELTSDQLDLIAMCIGSAAGHARTGLSREAAAELYTLLTPGIYDAVNEMIEGDDRE